MSKTRIQSNPFFVLGVSCLADRREVIAAAEEKSFTLDSATCLEAQSVLINANKRLSAELDWFFTTDTNELQEIIKAIDNRTSISTDSLTCISKLNATMFNFEISQETDYFEIGYSILEIDEQFSKLNVAAIVSTINGFRSKSRFPSVQNNEVSQELYRKRESIRQIIASTLSGLDEDSYVELISMIAEKCIAVEDYDNGVVIDDVVDQYEIRMQSVIEKRANEVRIQINEIESLTNDEAISDNINPLIKRIKEWDKYAQPLQIKSKVSGVPHEISETLGHDIRELVLYLHNEKGKTSEALTIVNAMREVFAENEGLLDIFDVDSEALNDLLKGQKEAKEILAEMDALQKQAESIKDYATSANVDLFIEKIKAINGRIKLLDLDDETKEKARENICYLARGTAIELHNAKHQTEYALRIAKAINTLFKDISSLANRLAMDEITLTVQLAQSGRSTPLHGGSSTGSYKSKSSNTGCLVSVIIGVVILIALAIGSSGGTTSSKSVTTKPSHGYSTSGNSSMPSQTPSTKPNTSSGTSQSELDTMRKDIEGMETRLKSMESDIEDMESELESLSDDLDYYEERYNATGNNTYYNSFYDTRDDYNAVYDDYSDAIDNYNALYDKYSKAIDNYNSKIN